MKKKKKENITIGIIAIILVVLIVSYNYNAEQVKLKGFTFGNELQSILEDLKTKHIDFQTKIVTWEKGDISREEMLDYSKIHIQNMEGILSEYDRLSIPGSFVTSVELFKLSTESQIESDKKIIEWIKTGDESFRIHSDILFQESFEFEMAALSEFNNAKLGIIP